MFLEENIGNLTQNCVTNAKTFYKNTFLLQV